VKTYTDLNTSARILLGPGPSMVHPRVLRAMAQPLVGHLDPQFIQLMKEVQEMLRYVFQTENQMTLPISGTGSAGMEACVANLIEPGDSILVCINGYFGERLFTMA
jgi:alanine-glyoxylate transaminase/serine-glyoxylate transaminase/serine-pyruvate transaminase